MTYFVCWPCADAEEHARYAVYNEEACIDQVVPERRNPADLAHPAEYSEPRCPTCGSEDMDEYDDLAQAVAAAAKQRSRGEGHARPGTTPQAAAAEGE